MKILIDWNLWENPKLTRLSLALFGRTSARDVHHSVGLLVHLWGWIAEFRPNGDLRGLSNTEIARASGWGGVAQKFVISLRKSGWLDRTQVHEWQTHQGKYIEKIFAERARKKKEYEARSLLGESEESPGESASPVSVSVSVSGAGSLTGSVSQEEKKEVAVSEVASGGADAPRLLAQALVELWNYGKDSKQWIGVTPARLSKIKTRLSEGFTEDQLRAAIVNIKQSEWHMGVNDRGWKAPGPEWVFNTRERTEQWINWIKPLGGSNGKTKGSGAAYEQYRLKSGSLEARARGEDSGGNPTP